MFVEIINMYGAEILGTLLVTLFGIFGMIAKDLAAKYLDTDTKRTLAKVVVQFIEQAYKHLHGEEKLNAALSVLADLLREKKIYATELEMKVLIEATVAEFNEVFKTPINSEGSAKSTYRVPKTTAATTE